ncbi:hypothetical protein B5X24_HaOG206046 [Helicoverpa armigera]|uniref:Uncharacterized protein n=1 Tax=Helicoverpa armigera TaxID=29058 RepID=A0A2W1BPK8_HELAM|nr:hypothetical protein B5X24_HaOG206046 [Helicoverpa armigera]
MTGVLFCDQEGVIPRIFSASFARVARSPQPPRSAPQAPLRAASHSWIRNAPNICQWRTVNAFSPHWRLSTNLCRRRVFLSTCYYLIQHFHSVLSLPFIFLSATP